jgi:hypothetical protein
MDAGGIWLRTFHLGIALLGICAHLKGSINWKYLKKELDVEVIAIASQGQGQGWSYQLAKYSQSKPFTAWLKLLYYLAKYKIFSVWLFSF